MAAGKKRRKALKRSNPPEKTRVGKAAAPSDAAPTATGRASPLPRLPDARKQEAAGTQNKNPCHGCDGRCCRLTVELTTFDIGRISSKLEKEGKPAGFVALDDALDDAFGFVAGGRRTRFVMRRKPDGSCIFLDPDGTLHCTINDAKPAICLTYPFERKDGSIGVRASKECPPENASRIRPDDGGLAKMLEDNRSEWDRYMEIIEDWNRRTDGSAGHEQFALFAMREMEIMSSPFGRLARGARRWLERKLR